MIESEIQNQSWPLVNNRIYDQMEFEIQDQVSAHVRGPLLDGIYFPVMCPILDQLRDELEAVTQCYQWRLKSRVTGSW